MKEERQRLFLAAIKNLNLEFPVAEISRKTGYTEGTISPYLKETGNASSKFIQRVADSFEFDAAPILTAGLETSAQSGSQVVSEPTKEYTVTKAEPGKRLEEGVPVYDVAFSAGTALSIMQDREAAPVIARLSLPEVIGCDAIIRARGNSMSDFIDDRDWVGIKMITDWDVLLWGYPYAIVTDELEVIKYVKKCKTPKNILLVSHNKDYEDVELAKTKINQLFLVKVVLPFSKLKTII